MSAGDPFGHRPREMKKIGKALGSMVTAISYHWVGSGLTEVELDLFERHLTEREWKSDREREYALRNLRAVRELIQVMKAR